MTYTVTQINNYIKNIFSRDYIMNHIVVEGEISNFKESRGNYYFNLKDENSYISCIMFSNFVNDSIKVLSDGTKINVTGSIRVYEKNGTYSIYVTQIERQGLGDYYLKLEKLKNKLLERGMFDDMYKKDIPLYSNRIGIVTAKNGAAIKDIEKTIRDKNPYAEMYLYPCKVQGDNAYESIISGINILDQMNLDCIIIGRGGGSKEDLEPFNNEELAYTIFNAKTPIISAVGHEINDSICDLVADLRVATPTAAGERATYSYFELIENIEQYENKLIDLIRDKINYYYDKVDEYKLKLDIYSPKNTIINLKSKYEIYNNNLKQQISYKLQKIKFEYENRLNILKSYNVIDKFDNGFSYVTNNKDKKIISINNVKVGDELNITLKDGKLLAKVKKIRKESI